MHTCTVTKLAIQRNEPIVYRPGIASQWSSVREDSDENWKSRKHLTRDILPDTLTYIVEISEYPIFTYHDTDGYFPIQYNYDNQWRVPALSPKQLFTLAKQNAPRRIEKKTRTRTRTRTETGTETDRLIEKFREYVIHSNKHRGTHVTPASSDELDEDGESDEEQCKARVSESESVEKKTKYEYDKDYYVWLSLQLHPEVPKINAILRDIIRENRSLTDLYAYNLNTFLIHDM